MATMSDSGVRAAGGVPDDLDIDALGREELLALRVDLRASISRLFGEKTRLTGIVRALDDGEAVAGALEARTLRHQRRRVNLEITAQSARLDRVKLRLFALQPPPKPRPVPAPVQQTTAEERAARLAQLDRDGPDALLLRVAGVLRRVLEAAGGDLVSKHDRLILRDLSFYLRQKYGAARQREE